MRFNLDPDETRSWLYDLVIEQCELSPSRDPALMIMSCTAMAWACGLLYGSQQENKIAEDLEII